jgi:hypothetical protein
VHTNRCCESTAAKRSITVTSRGPFARRCHDFAGWMLPAGGLVLLPKCPACLAAYIAIVTGAGVSISTATYLRMLLLTACIACIVYLAARRGRRLFALTPRSDAIEKQLDIRGPARCQTACEDHYADWQLSGHQL